jgi:hypothetical protein
MFERCKLSPLSCGEVVMFLSSISERLLYQSSNNVFCWNETENNRRINTSVKGGFIRDGSNADGTRHWE